ncbi:ComEA family DNA-binding protein [Marinigracilibium pacificum]|uniref:Helix-hairpin-helix domain-containing protein n=1 Tax=Marinigracilibium pacificum TaxID=2729599 RepID=A0A848IZV3_9BACT|nr:helix-hairpin-helix domain-containing protein [Marinigracilibium pacificum]NMM49136.1 helix-hairpin-helix domain-containing protein [Marinigracilibium pacificum]
MKTLLILLFILITFVAFSQSDIEDIIWFSQSQNPENQIDNDDLAQLIEDLKNNPININNCTAQDLSQIPFLSSEDIKNIIDHRSLYGEFILIEEISMISGFSDKKAKLLITLITINQPTNTKQNLSVINKAAYDSKFRDIKYRSSVQFHKQNFVVSIKTEKDAGESGWNKETSKIGSPEFLGGNIQYNSTTFKVILGDYKIGFGQGLHFNNAFFSSLGSYPIQSQIRSQIGIRTYNGYDEFNFNRGIATTLNLKKDISISSFISVRNIDAKIENDTIVTIYKSGFHRTETESNYRKTASLINTGLIIKKEFKDRGYLSFLADYSRWSNVFTASTAIDSPIKNSFHIGLSHQYTIKNKTLFGEISYFPIQENFSLTEGMLISLNKNWDYLIQLRYTTDYYFSIFGTSTGIKTNPNGEKGIYQALTYKLNKKLSGMVYSDISEINKISVYNPVPKSNEEFGIKVFTQPLSNWSLQLIYGFVQSQNIALNEGKNTNYRVQSYNHKAAIKSNFTINHNLLWDLQLQYRNLRMINESGYSFGFSQRLKYSGKRINCVIGTSYGYSEENSPGLYFYESGFYQSFPYIRLGSGDFARHYFTILYKTQQLKFGGKLSSFSNLKSGPLDNSQNYKEFEILISYQTK